jgi:hypothetical protein
VKNYIKNYNGFLNEQDMGMPLDPTADGGTSAPKKEKIWEFIFLDDGKKVSSIGPLQKDYALYTIRESELDAWLNTNIAADMPIIGNENAVSLEKIKKDLKNAITGEAFSLSDLDRQILGKFKNSVKAGIIDGTDSVEKGNILSTITVEFTDDDTPLTTDLAPTFLDVSRSKKH